MTVHDISLVLVSVADEASLTGFCMHCNVVILTYLECYSDNYTKMVLTLRMNYMNNFQQLIWSQD